MFVPKYTVKKDAVISPKLIDRTIEVCRRIRGSLTSYEPEQVVMILNSLPDILTHFVAADKVYVMNPSATNQLSLLVYRFAIQECIRLAFAQEKFPEKDSRSARLLRMLILTVNSKQNAMSIFIDMFNEVFDKTLLTKESITYMFHILSLDYEICSFITTSLYYSSNSSFQALGEKISETYKTALDSPTKARFQTSYNVLLRCINPMRPKFEGGLVNALPSTESKGSLLGLDISLAGLMQELGGISVSSNSNCQDLIDMFPNLTTTAVAECLGLMTVKTFIQGKDTNAYNSLRLSYDMKEISSPRVNDMERLDFPCAFVDAVKEKCPSLNWNEVFQKLDDTSIFIEDFSIIASMYFRATDNHLPSIIFMGAWENIDTKIKALQFIVDNPFFIKLPEETTAFVTDGIADGGLCRVWRWIDFIYNYVCIGSTSDNYIASLKHARKTAPALLFTGLLLASSFSSTALAFGLSFLLEKGPRIISKQVAECVKKGKHTAKLIALLSEFIRSNPMQLIPTLEVLAATELLDEALVCDSDIRLQVGMVIVSFGEVEHSDPLRILLDKNNCNALSDGCNIYGIFSVTLDICNEMLQMQKFVSNVSNVLTYLTKIALLNDYQPHVKAQAEYLFPFTESPVTTPTIIQHSSPVETEEEKELNTIRAMIRSKSYEVPPVVVQNRINFLITNTDPTNVETHFAELKQLVKPEYYTHFVNYIVTTRAALEVNHHDLYLQLLRMFDSDDLNVKVRAVTVEQLRLSFGFEKCWELSSRKKLKALGAWYGQITLARNLPIPPEEIDLTKLLFDAFEKGKLIEILPFITKVLEQCKPSTGSSFAPLHPWTMSILVPLVQLHGIPNLQIMLKFEIEFLIKELGLQMTQVQNYEKQNENIFANYPRFADLLENMNISKNNDFNPSSREVGGGGGIDTDALLGSHQALLTDDDIRPDLCTPKHDHQVHVHQYNIVKEDIIVGKVEKSYLLDDNEQQFRIIMVNIFCKMHEHDLKKLYTRVIQNVTNTGINRIFCDFGKEVDLQFVQPSALGMTRVLTANIWTTFEDIILQQMQKNVRIVVNQLVAHKHGINIVDVGTLKDEVRDLVNVIVRSNKKLFLMGFSSIAIAQTEDKVKMRLQTLNVPLNILPGALLPIPIITPLTLVLKRTYDNFSIIDPVIQKLHARLNAILTAYKTPIRHVDIWNAESFCASHQAASEPVILVHVVGISLLIDERYSSFVFNHFWEKLMCEYQSYEDNSQGEFEIERLQGMRLDLYFYILRCCISHMEEKDAISKVLMGDSRCWKSTRLIREIVRRGFVSAKEIDADLIAQFKTNKCIKNFASAFIDSTIVEGNTLKFNDMALTIKALHKYIPGESSQETNHVEIASCYVNKEKQTRAREYLDEWMPICCSELTTRELSEELVNSYKEKFTKKSTEFVTILLEKELPDVTDLNSISFTKAVFNGALDELWGTMLEMSIERYFALLLEQHNNKINDEHTRRHGDHLHNFLFYQESSLNDVDGINGFLSLDVFTELVMAVMKWSAPPLDDAKTFKTVLLSRVLLVTGKVLEFAHKVAAAALLENSTAEKNTTESHGYEYRLKEFYQQPFVRVMSNLMIKTLGVFSNDAQKETTVEGEKTNEKDASTNAKCIVTESQFFVKLFIETLHQTEPLKFPGFAFGWLGLVCHRSLFSKALLSSHYIHWDSYVVLLVSAFKFAGYLSRENDLSDSAFNFMRALLKVVYLIYNDCSTFFLVYCHMLCDAIPPCCIQHRNIILFAYPPSVDGEGGMLWDVTNPPVVNEKYINNQLNPRGIPDIVSRMIANETDVTELAKVMVDADGKWDITIINNSVTYIFLKMLELSNGNLTQGGILFTVTSLFCKLCFALKPLGRYHVLNGIFNHLRYPNACTQYFRDLLTFFFTIHATGDFVSVATELMQTREQIVQILIERCSCKSFRPYGLLKTFEDFQNLKLIEAYGVPGVK